MRRLALVLLLLLLVGAAPPAALVGAARPPALAGAARPAARVDAATRPTAGVPGAATRPVDGAVLASFDPPATPFGPGHRGVDLAAEPGQPVRAALPGEVRFAGQVAGRGWVTVDHGGGLDTTYGWIEPRLAGAGDRVEAGDILGLLAVDASHLDWGARLAGDYIDPLTLLGRWEAHLISVAPGR